MKIRTITCFGDRTSGTFLIIASVSRTKITRSHGSITLWMWMFSTVLNLLVYSLTGNRNFARKEKLTCETIAAPAHLQCQPSWVTAHTQFYQGAFKLWRQNTIPLMHRDHLVGNRYFVPFLVFYTESVMLGPRFMAEFVFYIQSVMLSPRFIFHTQSVVRSRKSVVRSPCFILNLFEVVFSE